MPGGYMLAPNGVGGIVLHRSASIPVNATGTHTIVPVSAGRRFIAREAWIRVLARTGTVTTNPAIRMGNGATPTNVCPALTLTTNTAEGVVNFPIAATMTAIDIGTNPIVVNVSTASAGASVFNIEVFLRGYII